MSFEASAQKVELERPTNERLGSVREKEEVGNIQGCRKDDLVSSLSKSHDGSHEGLGGGGEERKGRKENEGELENWTEKGELDCSFD